MAKPELSDLFLLWRECEDFVKGFDYILYDDPKDKKDAICKLTETYMYTLKEILR